jgi:hypothetical protein
MDQLRRIVSEAVQGEETVAVQAGHFLLCDMPDGTGVGACVASELHGETLEELKREHAQFPHLSWNLACDVLLHLPHTRRHILVLVNDWQYVSQPEERIAFFEEKHRLPSSYCAPLSGVTLLTPDGPADFDTDHPYFSERVLRNAFHRRLKKLVAAGKLPPGIEVEFSGSGASCSVLDAAGERKEIYCSTKSADCAGEVAELIDRIHALVSCETFINVFPSVCKQFVELGSEAARSIFGTSVRQVINIALPSTNVHSEQHLLDEAEITIHRF